MIELVSSLAGEARVKPRRRRAIRTVTARALHGRPLQLTDRKLARATLFPFFDGDGNTQWLLLAMEQPARVVLLEWRPGLVRKPLLRCTRLDLAWSALEDANSELAGAVSKYWHFDPWWLLTRASLAWHPASGPLLVTNAVEALEPATGLSYSSDLSRVVWLTRESSDGISLERYEPGHLPSSPLERPAKPMVASRSGWRLRPLWQR